MYQFCLVVTGPIICMSHSLNHAKSFSLCVIMISKDPSLRHVSVNKTVPHAVYSKGFFEIYIILNHTRCFQQHMHIHAYTFGM